MDFKNSNQLPKIFTSKTRNFRFHNISKILGLHSKIENNWIRFSFDDSKLEQDYLEIEFNLHKISKMVLQFFYFFYTILRLFINNDLEKKNFLLTNLLFSLFWITSFVLYIISKTILSKKILNLILSLIIIIIQGYSCIGNEYIFLSPSLQIRQINILFIFSIFEILFFFETNLIFTLLVLFSNLLICILSMVLNSSSINPQNQIESNYISNYNSTSENKKYFDIITCLFSIAFAHIFKRINSFKLRNVYYERKLFKEQFIYYNGIIDNMIGYQFTFRNKCVFNFNENLKKMIYYSYNLKQLDKKEVKGNTLMKKMRDKFGHSIFFDNSNNNNNYNNLNNLNNNSINIPNIEMNNFLNNNLNITNYNNSYLRNHRGGKIPFDFNDQKINTHKKRGANTVINTNNNFNNLNKATDMMSIDSSKYKQNNNNKNNNSNPQINQNVNNIKNMNINIKNYNKNDINLLLTPSNPKILLEDLYSNQGAQENILSSILKGKNEGNIMASQLKENQIIPLNYNLINTDQNNKIATRNASKINQLYENNNNESLSQLLNNNNNISNLNNFNKLAEIANNFNETKNQINIINGDQVDNQLKKKKNIIIEEQSKINREKNFDNSIEKKNTYKSSIICKFCNTAFRKNSKKSSNDNINKINTISSKEQKQIKNIYDNINNEFLIFSNYIEKYLQSLLPNFLEKSFIDFPCNNLLEFTEKLEKQFSYNSFYSCQGYNVSNKYHKFNLLGEFYREEDKKHFQIYFRKLPEHSAIDFLMYDLTEIRASQVIDLNSQTKLFTDLIFEIKNPINLVLELISRLGNIGNTSNFNFLSNIGIQRNTNSILNNNANNVSNIFNENNVLNKSTNTTTDIGKKESNLLKNNIITQEYDPNLNFNQLNNSVSLVNNNNTNSNQILNINYNNNFYQSSAINNNLKENFFPHLENICNFILLYSENILDFCNLNFNENKTKGLNQKLSSRQNETNQGSALSGKSQNINSLNNNTWKTNTLTNNNDKNTEVIGSGDDSYVKSVEDRFKINKNKLGELKNDKIYFKEICEFCKDICSTLLIFRYKENYGRVKVFCEFEEAVEKKDIFSDSQKIKQILINFISNSLKYTKKGFIKIRSELIEADKKIKISILDTGVGIDEKTLNILLKENLDIEKINKINRINDILNNNQNGIYNNNYYNISSNFNSSHSKNFKKNTKRSLNRQESSNYKRIGLGLKICKYLTKILNISLTINTRVGHGSEFSLYFPYEQEKFIETKIDIINNKNKIKINNKVNSTTLIDNININNNDSSYRKNNNKNNINQIGENDISNYNNETNNISNNNKNLNTGNNNLNNNSNSYSIDKSNDTSSKNNIILVNFKNDGSEEKEISITNQDNKDIVFKSKNKVNPSQEIRINDVPLSSDRLKEERSRILKSNTIESKMKFISHRSENDFVSQKNSFDSLKYTNEEVQQNPNKLVFEDEFSMEIESSNFDEIELKNKDSSNTLTNKETFKPHKLTKSKSNHLMMKNSLFKNEASKRDYDEEEKKKNKQKNITKGYIKNDADYIEKKNEKQEIYIKPKKLKNDRKKCCSDEKIEKVEKNIEKQLNKNADDISEINFKHISNLVMHKSDSEEVSEFEIDLRENQVIKKIFINDDNIIMRNSLKNLINKILRKKKLLDSFDIIEGFNGVDILYKMIHDQSQNFIKCIITADSMEYMKGSDALKILKSVEFRKVKQIPTLLLKTCDDGYLLNNKNIEWVDNVINKPCGENELLKFFKEYRVLE